ncbi:MAG: hypothetical protein NT013_16390 [Planctomycetia bacterium]|nr:hypothetical protein [Planctomycetia bacterium]
MRLKRLLLLTIAATLGCNSKPPAEKQLPEWLVKEMPKMESLSKRATEALDNAEAIELIFLVPDENYGPPMKEPDAEYFNWWKVISRVPLDESKRQEITNRLAADINANWKRGGADCFDPRHALRITTPDGPFDVVLCFHCEQLWCFYKDGKRLESQAGISKDLQPVLDQLKPAKVDRQPSK